MADAPVYCFTVLVPAYNEGPEFTASLERIHDELERLRPEMPAELLVVDDGSRDETAEAIGAFLARHPAGARAVRHAANRGLAEAIQTGARQARSPYVVVLDADLSYGPETIGPLVRAVALEGAAIAVASPYMRGGSVSGVPPFRLAVSRLANWLLATCARRHIKTFTGMVRGYRTEALLRTSRQGRGEFNARVLAAALRENARVIEVPAHLGWPEVRRRAPSRLRPAQLLKRTGAVFRVAQTLAFS